MSAANLEALPKDLPAPVDDGACAHLEGSRLPDQSLPAINGTVINLSGLKGWLVLYAYPMTGTPGVPLPDGWDQIPGARGCTPQSCAFRNHHAELQKAGVKVFGLSTQATEAQREAAERLHLPFLLLSDASLAFARALGLPTFEVQGMQLTRRVTLIAHDGIIRKVFYPVFPPDRNAEDVIRWLVSAQ